MAARDFCTVSDVKHQLLMKTSVTQDDALLQQLITAVSSAFRTILSRDILSGDYVETRDGPGGRVLMLKNYPVTAVASLSVGAPGHYVALTPNVDYVFTATAVKLLSVRGFGSAPASIIVAYTAGYTTVPYDIAEKASKVAALRYKQLQRLGQASKSIGGETVTFETKDMPEDVVGVLRQYQRMIPIPAS